jgi:hypothetical protein
MFVLTCAGVPAHATEASVDGGDNYWRICAEAIGKAEKAAKVPRHLMLSIAIVESGRRNEETERYAPWPWTINAKGEGSFFDSKEDAISAVRDLRDQDISNIDVGCMQVNLSYHPNAFEDLEDAFDPEKNAAYASRFLRSLFGDTGSWFHAIARYHSSTYRNNRQYLIRVAKTWHRLKGNAPRTQ